MIHRLFPLLFVAGLVAVPTAAQDAPVYPSDAGPYRVETVADGLNFPWGMQFLPDGGMLVTEKDPGRLRVVRDGVLVEQEISGLPEIVVRGQGGLMDVRLHPGFEDNSMVYLSYSRACTTDGGDNGATTAVVRGALDLDAAALTGVEDIFVADACTARGQHFGSRMVFDDEGYLFVTVGDRGEMQQAQNTANHQGTVNRLNDDGSIPSDNPFVGRNGYQPSIWAYGLRSPQGLAIHPETRELWETEHGPQGGDELNRIEAGSNYGWPIITYGVNYGSSRRPIGDGIAEAPGLEQPVHYWVPSIATSGLVIYDGDVFPEWRGSAFVGGLAGQQLARVEFADDGSTTVEVLLGEHGQRIRDVRQGPDGHIYLLTDVGGEQASVLRLAPATAAN
ncbi:MAG TPA: PQQ-dependent sugar dehydrogenase [Longimicrobiales bacterium]|nr:PQQ-dependent sugar dehydrogenase [Longimicrobiales bacterium]